MYIVYPCILLYSETQESALKNLKVKNVDTFCYLIDHLNWICHHAHFTLLIDQIHSK